MLYLFQNVFNDVAGVHNKQVRKKIWHGFFPANVARTFLEHFLAENPHGTSSENY